MKLHKMKITKFHKWKKTLTELSEFNTDYYIITHTIDFSSTDRVCDVKQFSWG